MAFKLLPGTERQFEQLRTLMPSPFVALVAGPPGVGKRALLDHVAEQAGLRTADFDIEHSKTTAAELRALIAKRLTSAQITEDAALRANTVWVVHNAELLDAHAAVWQNDVTCGLRIILKVNDTPPKLREVFKKPIHFNRVTDTRVAAWVREHCPSADAAHVATVAGGDLRQAAIAAAMPSGGNKDFTGHVHFDTLALVNGGKHLDPRQVSTDWVRTNMLGRCTSIEEAARLSETFATVDAMRCWDAVQATPGLEADIIQGAVHQVRASGKVRYVQGLNNPKGLPQTAATTGQAARAVRRHRGMLEEVLRAPATRRRAHPEPEEARSTRRRTQAEPNAPALGAEPAPRSHRAPEEDAPPDEATGQSTHIDRTCSAGGPGENEGCSTGGNGSSGGSGGPPGGSGSAGGSDGPGGTGGPSARTSAAVQGRIVYDGRPEFEVRKATPVTQQAMRRSFTPGPLCGNSCKSRVVIFGKCRRLEDFHAIAQTTGVLGCIVAEFNEGAYALIFKERNREFRACEECYSLCDGRVSHTVVEAACALFMDAANIRDVELHRKGPAANQEMPDFEDACELLKDTSLGDFGALHANALKAKRYKRCTPLREAILTYTADLKEFMHAKEDAESMIFKTTSPGPHFLHNFKRATVLNMQGVHYESDGTIHVTTLRGAISESQSPTKPPLYLTKTLIFVGLAGGGKSEFMHALAREFCQRNGRTCYGFSASIDPFELSRPMTIPCLARPGHPMPGPNPEVHPIRTPGATESSRWRRVLAVHNATSFPHARSTKEPACICVGVFVFGHGGIGKYPCPTIL